MPDTPWTLDNAADLKALAHPLRIRIFYALRAEERATASGLAETLGESPALLSYHLRELGKRGFVAEEPDPSDRRKRWWSLKMRGYSFSSDSADLPTRLASDALKGQLDDYLDTQLHRYRASREAWSEEWREAASEDNYIFRLTPAELGALHAELTGVLRKWLDTSDGRDAPEGSAQVMYLGKAFPYEP